MKKNYMLLRSLCTVLFVFGLLCTNAQISGVIPADKPPTITSIDTEDISGWLENAPMEDTPAAENTIIVIDLPLPDGTTIEVKAIEAPVMKGKAADQYQEIKTYTVYGVEDPHIFGKLTISPYGLHAYVTNSQGEDFYIEPDGQGVRNISAHKTYYVKDGPQFVHGGPDDLGHDGYLHDHGDGLMHTHDGLEKFATTKVGDMTRSEYETLFIADDTYYNFHRGGNAIGTAAADAAVTAAITAMVASINVIYERDLAMRLVTPSVGYILFRSNPTVGGNPLFPASPTSRGDANVALEVFDAVVTNNSAGDNATVDAAIVTASTLADNTGIAVATFDVGHLVAGQGGGGSAYVGVSCRDTKINGGFDPGKGGGGSATSNPVGSGWVQLVAHEFGHQFGAPHSWNAGTTLCGSAAATPAGFCDRFGQYSPGNGYEPGAGITLMSYAGICDQHNILNYNSASTASSITYIHARSVETIRAHINSVSCDAEVMTMNKAPDITLPACTSNIPRGTPFDLTASATDANGNALTYSWEQLDLGAQGPPGQGGGTSAAAAGVGETDFTCSSNMPTTTVAVTPAMNTGSPTFRSYEPSTSPTRTFPIMQKVLDLAPAGNLSNTADRDGEVVPNYARTMIFRFSARDNNGAISWDDQTVTMDANGPFNVTAPATSAILAADGTTNHTISWNANGFTGCSNVNIKLSTDGGNTFPITLGTAAFGPSSTTVTIPAGIPASTNARIRVECGDGNCATFFNVSGLIEITSSCAAAVSQICPPDACSLPAGAVGLNLSLSSNYTSAFSGGTFPEASPVNITVNDMAGTGCFSGNLSNAAIITFQVETSGSYTVNVDRGAGGGFAFASLFDAGFNAGSACATFLASSGTDVGGGSVSAGTSLSANLSSCTTYTVVGWNFGLSEVTITSITGSGSVLTIGSTPAAPFDTYTYVAIDDATTNIAAQSATSNFSALGVGCYQVYGISYENTLDPNTWVGNSINSLITAGNCLLPSNNSKTLKVTSSCSVATGSLVISEIMYNPATAEPAGEWFEVFNPTAAPIDMNGLQLCDNAGSHTIASSVVVPAMGYAVLGSNADMSANGGVTLNYAYGTGLAFNNSGGDVVTIKCADGTVIDQVDYSGFPGSGNGASIQLRPSEVDANGATDNDTAGNWFVTGAGDSTGGAGGYGTGGLGTPGSVNLPVELLNFTATLIEGKVDLDWITVSELNNDHFVVERSADGLKFEALGKVQGAGTTIEMQRYQYLDLAPEFGLNYYRLKQVDTDGTYEYSDIVSVNLAKDELTAKVYPSPTNSFLNVEISKEMNALEILDLTGRVLISKSYEDTKFTQINVSNLPVGTYFVNLQLENTIKVLRFVKN